MAFAPSPEAEQITRDLANDLMSPYCPGRTISSCPSEQARKLEDHIMEQAEAGATRAEIEQTLIAQFGEEKLGSRDDPVVVYGSVAAAILGALLVFVAARRWLRASTARGSPGASTGTAGAASSPAAAPSQAELDGLEDALDDLEEF